MSGIYKSAFGFIKPQDFSSGVKSILLVMYRLKYPEYKWIPRLDSMGDNAREYLFRYLLNEHIPDFMLYCTNSFISYKMDNFKCMNGEGSIGLYTEIIRGMHAREGFAL